MNESRSILILTASAGAGHTVAAEALAQAFERRAARAAGGGVPVLVHDVLESAMGIFRRVYADGYDLLVDHFPAMMGWLYERTDHDRPQTDGGVRSALQEWALRRTRRWIRAQRPALIVNTHFLPAELVAGMRRRHEIDCPQVTLVTDFDTHRFWFQPPTERYFTAFDQGAEPLRSWGVAADQVRVTGIPVRPGFQEANSRLAARRTLALAVDRPIVLLLCGGCGTEATLALVRQLVRVRADAQLAIVCGRHPGRHSRLQRYLATQDRDARLIRYTDQMHLWMRAADLVVSKPGGLTSTEALVSGLPMVIVHPIPGQEARNSDFLLEQGAAVKANSARMLAYHVNRLLGDPARLRAMQANATALGRPDAAETIACDALALAGIDSAAGARRRPAVAPVLNR